MLLRFLYQQFLISKCSSILHVLLDLQEQVLEFHIESSLQEFQLSHFLHSDIHHGSIFALNCLHSYQCTFTVTPCQTQNLALFTPEIIFATLKSIYMLDFTSKF